MTWLRIDDGMPENTKVSKLSVAAKWARVELLCYCARNLTDGHVPADHVRRMATQRQVKEMIDAELARQNGNGIVMHDYLEYNPSRAQVMAERSAAAERVRKSREKRRGARDVTGGETA